MQRIAVDMDGVLSDTVEQFIAWEERESGTKKNSRRSNGDT